MEHDIDMQSKFEGEEGRITVTTDNAGVQIEHAAHGKIYLAWEDFHQVADAARAYHRAETAVGEKRFHEIYKHVSAAE